MQITYRFRLKDKHCTELRRQSRAVNYVWNFCNETQKHALRWDKKWPSGYDLEKLTAGSSRELDLHAHTIQQTCLQYERSRKQHRKATLRWRGRNSLGWVPFNNGHVAYREGAFWFRGERYDAWVSRELKEGQRFGAGSFSQDSQGRWYINLPTEAGQRPAAQGVPVGIDLGLKDFAALSTGEKISAPRWYRNAQERLATAQRAGKKRRVKAINRRIANLRNEHQHQLSTRLVREHRAIFVGNVNSAKLCKTGMAKSVLDAGWSQFRAQLAYKAIRQQGAFKEVDEAYSTQTCSSCGTLPPERPKGIAGLGIREWTCGSCGSLHDRDVNAARNILARGLASLAEGACA